jgi:hypothetical protein
MPVMVPVADKQAYRYRQKTTEVKYGVRSPKFIWAPCAQLYSLADYLSLIIVGN